MAETRKIAAILAADIVGFSRMASADEDRTLAHLRALRADVIDPIIANQNGRVFKRTGDGARVEFRGVVEAVRSAISVQNAMMERNVGLPADQRIDFRIGIHLGDVVEESDGDLMGDGVNIAARLEGTAEPGAICLSEQAYWQVKGRLDLAVTDLGPTQLKNIAEPVRVYSLRVGVPPLVKPIEARPAVLKPRSLLPPIVAGILALIIIAGGARYFLARNLPAPILAATPATVATNASNSSGAAHLSIVVLPFTNLSNDPSQDYFADGITENLTTDLSHIRDSFVIARNTAFAFKGKNADAKVIGKELGVRYVLEGSVQRDQNRVRINAQLIDAETGAHLWADRFEENVADLFKLQDQVVARLANSLGYELIKAEADKSALSKNPDATDLDMRGQALLLKLIQQSTTEKEVNHAAQALFEQALKIDPNDANALAGAAYTYYLDYTLGWTVAEIDYEPKILGQLDRATALAPDNVLAYYVKIQYLANSHRAEEALVVADAAIAINSNDAMLLRARGSAEISVGRFEQGKSDVQQAMRISPRDPRIGLWLADLGGAELGLRHFDAAIDQYHKAIDAGWRSYLPYRGLAAAYALSGKMDEAKARLASAAANSICKVRASRVTISSCISRRSA
jgi:adenylate cyclase